MYHGPEGLKKIADRVHGLAAVLAAGAKQLGHGVPSAPFFDTVAINVGNADKVVATALKHKVRAGTQLGAVEPACPQACGSVEGPASCRLW